MQQIENIWKRFVAVILSMTFLVTAVPAAELWEDAESYSVHTTELTDLEASAGTWNKAFRGDELDGYVLTLGPEESGFYLTAMSAETDPNVCPTITIDGKTVAQGTQSQTFSLEIGEKKTILIEVTSRRDDYHRIYEVIAYRTDFRSTLRASVREGAEGQRVAQIDFLLPAGTTLDSLSLWMEFDPAQMQICQMNGEVPTKLAPGKILGTPEGLANFMPTVKASSNETGKFRVDLSKNEKEDPDYTVSDGETPVLTTWFLLEPEASLSALEVTQASVHLPEVGLAPYYDGMVRKEGFPAAPIPRPERPNETTSQGYLLDCTEYTGNVIAAYAFSQEVSAANAIAEDDYIRMDWDGLMEVEPAEDPLLEPSVSAAVFQAEEPPKVGATKSFSMRDFRKSGVTADGWSTGSFQLAAVCPVTEDYALRIWLSTDETRGVELTAEQLETLAKGFADCYGYLAEHLHPVRDTNGNGGLDLLLYDIYDEYTNGGSSYTGGFVNANEFFGALGTGKYPFGNHGDVVHLDVKPQLGSGLDQVISTMAHETQHMCMYSAFADMGAYKKGAPPTWINEGLSMTVEDALFGPIASRVHTFNTSAAIRDGKSLTDWTGTLSDYALSYLFFQYVQIQTGNADFAGAFYRSYENGNTPETVLQGFSCFAGKSIDEIFQNFYLALWLREESGPYGVGGNAALEAVRPQCVSAVPEDLVPTGAVYVKNSDALELPENRQLQFVGITAPVSEPDNPPPTPIPTPEPEDPMPDPEPEEPDEPIPATLQLAQVILNEPEKRGLLPRSGDENETAVGFNSAVNGYDLHLLSTDPADVTLTAVCKGDGTSGVTATLTHLRNGETVGDSEQVLNYAGDLTLQRQTVTDVQDGDEIELRVSDETSENVYTIYIHRTDAAHDPQGSVSFREDSDGFVRMKVTLRHAQTNAVTVTVPFGTVAPELYNKNKEPYDGTAPETLSLLPDDAAYEIVQAELKQDEETYLLEMTVALKDGKKPTDGDLLEIYCKKGEAAGENWYGDTADMALYDLNRIYLEMEIPTKAESADGQTVTGIFYAYKAEEYTPDGAFRVYLTAGTEEFHAESVTAGPADTKGLCAFTYSINSVPAGTYTLVVNKPGHTPLEIQSIVVEDSAYTVKAQPTLIVGDIDGDGWVRTRDKALLTQQYGPVTEYAVEDLDGDGAVRTRDLSLLMANLGLGALMIEEEQT